MTLVAARLEVPNVEIGEVDVEAVQHPSTSNIIVPGERTDAVRTHTQMRG